MKSRDTDLDRYRAALGEAGRQIRAGFSRSGFGPNCSSITAVIKRAALQPKGTLSIIMSDAVETCRSKLELVPTPPPDVQVIFILVPPKHSHARDGAESFEAQKKNILTVASWVHVVPPWLLLQAVCQRRPAPAYTPILVAGGASGCEGYR